MVRSYLIKYILIILLLGIICAPSAFAARADVEDFVARFYQLCLSRNPDTVGLNGWVDALINEELAGADVAYGFVFSQEFVKKSTGDKEYLEVLYRAFFDRDPDVAGMQGWLDALAGGSSRVEALDGFIYSTEFENLCSKFGIEPFIPLRAFVTRFYRLCLGREPDSAGLENWIELLRLGTKTGADVAEGFIYSQEFINNKTSNEAYLTVLYKAFFNRPADLSGWNTWLAELNTGKAREDVLKGFIYSQEFENLCVRFGIKPFENSDDDSSSRWVLSDEIANLPEVYTGSIDASIVEEYESLVGELHLMAQKWIVKMGWGLEDLDLDPKEVSLLELLAKENIATIMSIMTHPKIIDGLEQEEVTWAAELKTSNLSEILEDDVNELLAMGYITSSIVTEIESLIGKAAVNSEIAKGLHLINNFGRPNQGWFGYPLPKYNTQVLILGKLLALGIPDGYEVAAVAAALDYGTLWSIADSEVQELIVPYAHEMLLYQAETDQIMQNWAAWKDRNLALEHQIVLMWGGTGNYRAVSIEEGDIFGCRFQKEKRCWRGFYHYFKDRLFTISDWNYVMVTIERLRQMRAHLLSSPSIKKNNPDSLGDSVRLYWIRDKLDYQYNPLAFNIGGQHYYASYICNVNFEWDYFKKNGNFIGTSGDAYIFDYLMRSLNWPGITTTYLIHTGTYYSPAAGSWKGSKSELELLGSGSWCPRDIVDTRMGWNKVPFDNFHLDETMYPENKVGRLRFLRPMQAYPVFKRGIPNGYIFRADVSTEASPIMTCP